MSHNIEHRTCADTEKARKDAFASIDKYVRHQTWEEGGGGIERIRWLDNAGILEDYDTAESYLNDHDNGWYDNLAVRYYEFDRDILKSAKLTELTNRWMELRKQREAKDKIYYVETVKSAYIGCKRCGSKLSREWLVKNKGFYPNKCPLCHEDFRSETTLNSLKALDERIKKADAAMEAERKKLQLKMRKQAKVKWLIKYEYHT